MVARSVCRWLKEAANHFSRYNVPREKCIPPSPRPYSPSLPPPGFFPPLLAAKSFRPEEKLAFSLTPIQMRNKSSTGEKFSSNRNRTRAITINYSTWREFHRVHEYLETGGGDWMNRCVNCYTNNLSKHSSKFSLEFHLDFYYSSRRIKNCDFLRRNKKIVKQSPFPYNDYISSFDIIIQ